MNGLIQVPEGMSNGPSSSAALRALKTCITVKMAILSRFTFLYKQLNFGDCRRRRVPRRLRRRWSRC
jgi:hypothetical protein